jgi:aminoglycoside 3-N-acetyltransferase
MQVSNFESSSPIMFHTDLSKIERKTLKGLNSKIDVMEGLHRKLKETFHDQELWFPAFNYDFTKTGVFDPANDPIQVGALNEFLRKSGQYTRSPVPVFSMLREHASPTNQFREIIEPFGIEGDYAELSERDGHIIFFGASIDSLTYIHFLETLVEIPYRYSKIFEGKVKLGSEMENVAMKYLVRPSGISLDYDWEKIHQEFVREKIFRKIDSFGGYEVYNARILTGYMMSRYSEDIYWTLKEDSRKMVETKIQELGRSFRLSDFESGEINA